MRRYLFVGERRSPTAIERGWTWERGRLAGRTLHAALLACGIEAGSQGYCNLFDDHAPGSWEPVPQTLDYLRDRLRRRPRPTLVALGRRVQHALTAAGIPHVPMIHPAARGAIRKRERYHAHVAATLR